MSYLHSIDPSVQYINYGDLVKPYLGILLQINAFKYYVPISSAKQKHSTMKNALDLIKLIDPKNNKLLSVINLNNMVPIPDCYIEMLDYNKIDLYRKFNCPTERQSYIDLLRKELDIIKSLSSKIEKNALKLYYTKNNFPEYSVSRRCCNFTLLEKKSGEYSTK